MKLWNRTLKWLYPGLRVKRWLLLGFAGLLLLLVGASVIFESLRDGRQDSLTAAHWIIARTEGRVSPWLLGILVTAGGGAVAIFAVSGLVGSIMAVVDPDLEPGDLVEALYKRRRLARGQRIVVIGGGTGLSTMLRGLKHYSSNITAIVTVSDDGGSSGRLIRQLNILPPGDIRNCLVALADSEPQMTELFQYRFGENIMPRGEAPGQAARPAQFGEGLRDHAFGNLLIAAMCAINGGDFERAIRETSRVLNIRGRVLPSTVSLVQLEGEMEDGSVIRGETNIAQSPLRIRRVSLVPGSPAPIDDVIDAILKADVIVLGPGSVFTSIVPNLLVRGIPEAIYRSRAMKVYVCNVMTQKGETDGFTAYDHIKNIERHACKRVFDYVLVNTGHPSAQMVEKYHRSGSVLVQADIDRIKADGYRPITGNFINQTDVVRHDTARLASAIIDLIR